MNGAVLVVDKTWAATVLAKLGQTPSGGTKKKTTINDRNRAKSGYAWHKAAKPQDSQVGSRAKMDDDGIITTIDIAGRPQGKHGGKQGQHTTAFGAVREVVLSATVGRDEAAARTDLALLFKTLLAYPAFTDPTQPPPDPDLTKLLDALKDPNSALSTSYSIRDLSTLYLEIRDSLPGASLNTGADGKASKSSLKNTSGKGEGTTLAELRSTEEHALEYADLDLDDYDFDVAIRCMRDLYDASSETSAEMDSADARAQQLTCLWTIAQAFPQTFLKVGSELVKKFDQLKPGDETAMFAVCTQLAGNNSLGARPQPMNFLAGIEGGKIIYHGRSDSVKDSGTMGDHTCSEQLMKNAATSLLLPSGADTTNGELIGGLQTIGNQFQIGSYEGFNQDIDPSYPAHMCKVRFDMLQEHLNTLDALLDRIGKLDKEERALPEDVIEAAELYMQLVDDRPTAVNYGAPAGGHGEGTVLGALASTEDEIADGSYMADSEDLFKQAAGLLDHVAAFNTAELMRDYAEENDEDEGIFDTCVATVADEFMFFFEHAYPLSFAKMTEGGTGWLKGKIINLITTEGSVGRDKDYEEYDFEDDSGRRKKKAKVTKTPAPKPKPKRKVIAKRKR